MSGLSAPVIDLSLPHPRNDVEFRIATLGPAGTSSEQSAQYLRQYLSISWPDRNKREHLSIDLYPRYEDAADSVLRGNSTLLLVANAYHAASVFYMDPALAFSGAYCFDTPHYGIAANSGVLPTGEITVASHPAPIPIIAQLLTGTTASPGSIMRVDSTSAAARSAATGDVDVALTTEPAAQLHDLTFVTKTRPIRMLWSVFTAAQNAVTGGANARVFEARR